MKLQNFLMGFVSHCFCKVNNDNLPKGSLVWGREGNILDTLLKEYVHLKSPINSHSSTSSS